MRLSPWLFAALFVASAPAFTQGSRSSGGPSSDYGDFSVLRSVTGVLVAADEKEGTLVVKPDGASESVSFKVAEKIRLGAEKKSALSGRKGLALADFEAGQTVKVTFRATDLTAVEMRLRAPR